MASTRDLAPTTLTDSDTTIKINFRPSPTTHTRRVNQCPHSLRTLSLQRRRKLLKSRIRPVILIAVTLVWTQTTRMSGRRKSDAPPKKPSFSNLTKNRSRLSLRLSSHKSSLLNRKLQQLTPFSTFLRQCQHRPSHQHRLNNKMPKVSDLFRVSRNPSSSHSSNPCSVV